jgi:hypothetical protein
MLRATHSQVWWGTPAIPTLRRLRQEDHEFKANLGYISRPSFRNKKQKQK